MRLRTLQVALFLAAALGAATQVKAQPIVDSLKSIQLRNEKLYRQLNALDDKGASYEFTNVTAWKVTDEELRSQLQTVIKNTPFGEKRLKDIDISDIFLFAAPTKTDRFEPFHILFVGKRAKAVDSNEVDDPFGFGGGGGRRRGGQDLYIAFKGRDVIRLMQRQPALADNINAIQGEIVELPGDILPSGAQLIKSSAIRYIYHRMFEGFYPKRLITDVQRTALGLPTSEEEFVADTAEDLVSVPDPEATTALPDVELEARAFRGNKFLDISADHAIFNVARNTAIELQLGNPEVGLPFWTSGQGRLWYTLKNQVGRESNFKLGVTFPINLGRNEELVWSARRISGGWGGSVDAYFAGIDFFSAFNMPLALNLSVLPAGGKNSSIIYNGGPALVGATDGSAAWVKQTFFRTSLIGQLFIPFIVQLDPANFVQFSAGVGVHNVQRSYLPTEADTKTGVRFDQNGRPILDQDGRAVIGAPLFSADKINKIQDLERVSTPFTPHVGIEYVNHRTNKFGLNMFYDHLFTFGGWIELFEDFLRLEMSYTAPLVREAKPYEPNSFFQITPRFYF